MKVLSEGFFFTLLLHFKNIQQGHGIVPVCGSMSRLQVLGNHLWKGMKEMAGVDSTRNQTELKNFRASGKNWQTFCSLMVSQDSEKYLPQFLVH